MASFLVDEDLPVSIAKRLAERGIDAAHVVDAGLRATPDKQILAAAVAQKRSIVTADKEFGNIIVYPPKEHHGVVLIRVPEHIDPDDRLDRTVSALASLASEDLSHAVVVVEPSRLRIRKTD